MESRKIIGITALIVCLVLIIAVIFGLRRHSHINEPEVTIELLENVYIVASEEGKVRFLYDGTEKTVVGELDEQYAGFTGFADITVDSNGQLIEVIKCKTDFIEGTLEAYTENRVKVEGLGWMDMSENVQAYRTYAGSFETVTLSDYVLGATQLQYYKDTDGVFAVIQTAKTTTEDISVLIKDSETGEKYHEKLYLYSKGPWFADSDELPAEKTFNALDYMISNSKASIIITSDRPIAITDSKGHRIGEYYEGSLTIVNYLPEEVPTKTKSRLVLVNTLPIETYIRYVLPSEMPSSFGYEAKRAQAVCARTYAYSQMKNGAFSAYGANLDDSTMYQVYNANGTAELTDKAAESTKGIVATNEGSLISCYYYSTAPGFTHGLEAWDADDVPYLTYHNQTDNDYGDMRDGINVLSAIVDAPHCYDYASPFYRWTATLEFSKKRLAEVKDAELGKLVSFKITKRTQAGYVCGMELTYADGTKELSSELEVRRFLGKFLTKLTLNNEAIREDFTLIPCAFFAEENGSNEFEISKITGKKITLIGGGFGHGIGMSQYGAAAMSDAGMGYSDIMHYYYNEIELVEVNQIDVFE